MATSLYGLSFDMALRAYKKEQARDNSCHSKPHAKNPLSEILRIHSE